MSDLGQVIDTLAALHSQLLSHASTVSDVRDQGLLLESVRMVEQASDWLKAAASHSGPSGYKPSPAYEKCSSCDRWRLA